MLKQILIGFAEFILFLLLVEVDDLILQKVIAFLIKKQKDYLKKTYFVLTFLWNSTIEKSKSFSDPKLNLGTKS